MKYSEIVIAEIQNGNFDEVAINMELALESDDSDTLYLLGNTLFQLGFLNETKRVYNHLIDIHPEDDELKIYLAEIEIEDGRELDALDLLHSINSESEMYPQSLLVQADYYHLNGLPEVSLQKLEEAENLLEDEPVIKFAIAEVYFTIADYQNAIIKYNDIVEQGIEEISGTIISARLGSCYLMIGDYAKAIEYLEDALSYKDDPEIFYQLGIVYVQQEEYTKAIEPLEQAIEHDPSLTGAHILLAEVYEKQNDIKKALEMIENGIQYNDIYLELYFKAAELSAKLDKLEQAESYYQRAMNIEPDNDSAVVKYAEFLSVMEDDEKIIDLYDNVSDTIRQLPESLWILAKANNALDEYDTARKYYEQANLYLDDDSDFLKEYAFFLREDGQRDKMKVVINKYLTLIPGEDFEMAALLDEFDY